MSNMYLKTVPFEQLRVGKDAPLLFLQREWYGLD